MLSPIYNFKIRIEEKAKTPCLLLIKMNTRFLIHEKGKPMTLVRSIIVYSMCLFSLFGIPTSQADTVHIAVASNFTHPMKTLIGEFEKKSSHTVKASYGSSGKIYAQIKHGAPFDIFFSADQTKPLALYNEGVAYSAPFTYAIGGLALWSNNPKYKNKNLEAVLQSNAFNKLAIANPKLAPYGRAAYEVLENLNLIDTTRKKWVKGENIAQTYQFVSTGNADLGFVALSQMVNPSSYWNVPTHLYQPIRQDAVLLKHRDEKRGARNKAALDFIQFINTPQSHAIIQSYGYRSGIKAYTDHNASRKNT